MSRMGGWPEKAAYSRDWIVWNSHSRLQKPRWRHQNHCPASGSAL